MPVRLESNEMANQSSHKYYCIRCDRFLYEQTPALLAITVNLHAAAYHPTDCSSWTAEGITLSAHYTNSSGPLPQYLEPHGTTSKREIKITKEDEAMLQRAGIKW
jgi:hypothetical protein